MLFIQSDLQVETVQSKYRIVKGVYNFNNTKRFMQAFVVKLCEHNALGWVVSSARSATSYTFYTIALYSGSDILEICYIQCDANPEFQSSISPETDSG